jgi:hypothetical protein
VPRSQRPSGLELVEEREGPEGIRAVGPSMSTEPGWMGERRETLLLLGERNRPRPPNCPSMLLSFERPASAGDRVDMSFNGVTAMRETGRRYRLSTVLENCTEATNRPPSISGGR